MSISRVSLESRSNGEVYRLLLGATPHQGARAGRSIDTGGLLSTTTASSPAAGEPVRRHRGRAEGDAITPAPTAGRRQQCTEPDVHRLGDQFHAERHSTTLPEHGATAEWDHTGLRGCSPTAASVVGLRCESFGEGQRPETARGSRCAATPLHRLLRARLSATSARHGRRMRCQVQRGVSCACWPLLHVCLCRAAEGAVRRPSTALTGINRRFAQWASSSPSVNRESSCSTSPA